MPIFVNMLLIEVLRVTGEKNVGKNRKIHNKILNT